MQFWKDMERESGIWVDRGIDSRLDNFTICDPCGDALRSNDTRGQRWHEGEELCPTCRTDFEARALAIDLLGLPRPFNGMLEERVLTNDELAADPVCPVPGALDYFLASKRGRLLPGAGDPLLPDPEDYFLPE